VKYAGFAESPYFALAQKYMPGKACSLMSVGVKGGYAAAVGFHDALNLVTRLVNLGDAKSLVCHPASDDSSADVGGRSSAAPVCCRR